jgi:hypothetical protein
MSTVHIKGFGLIGSLLAWELTSRKIMFSWEDNDTPGAWKASTGCIYPSGEELDAVNYDLWLQSFGQADRRPIILFSEAVPYGYTQKSIPHHNNSKELKYVETVGNIKILNKQSMHVNVQAFVQFTQEFFFSARIDKTPTNRLVIHANGFHKYKPTDYRWGWSVECKPSGEVFNRYPRFCLNAKEGRFINAYLYPKPTTDTYYLGTHFIYQKEQKDLEIKDKIEKIVQHISKVTDGQVSIEITGEPKTGWRPAYMEEYSHAFIQEGSSMYVTPKSANGLRHAPTYIKELADGIQEYLYATSI